MTDLQAAKKDWLECREQGLCDQCSDRHGVSCCVTDALIAAYEAELLRRERCGNCCLSWDAGGVCSGSPGGRCKHATPDNPHGKWRLQE